MSVMQRRKGQSGERAAAAILTNITGIEVRRKVRQHEGDSDLDFPGWSIEIKRHAKATPATVAEWWQQTVRQAERAGLPPLLVYRPDRRPWRCVWAPTGNTGLSVEADVSTWWALQPGWHPTPADPAIVDPGPA
jgi:hypothetical protein